MSKAIIFVLFLTNVLVATACSPKENTRDDSSATISQTDTVTVKPFLVDVRTPEEFAAGSVKGAVNIPLDQVATRIAEFQGKEQIVVFCRSGNRSGQAMDILTANGIKNVTNGGSWEDVAEVYK